MFKNFFLLLSLFLVFTVTQAQQCENLILEDVPMICTGDEVTLTAEFLNGAYKSTRAYVINGPLPCPISTIEQEEPSNIIADDDWSFDVSMPFNFCFFENQYNKFVVSDNGKISFDISLNEGQFDEWQIDNDFVLPTQQIQTNAIFAPFIDTLSTADPFPGTTITFGLINEDDPGNRIFAINFDVPQFSCTDLRLRSRVLLYETSNIIDIIIFEKPVCDGWNGGRSIVGIQNKSGTIGYSPFNRGVLDDSNTPPTQGHTWIPGDADSPNFDTELGELFRFVPDGLDSEFRPYVLVNEETNEYAAPSLIFGTYTFAWFRKVINETGTEEFEYFSGDESITIAPEEVENFRFDLTFQTFCEDASQEISIFSTVTPLKDPIALESCESALGLGVADFDLNQTDLIVNGLSISQYNISYTNSVGDPITVLSPYTSAGETITVTVEDPEDNTCFSTFTFDLAVMPLLDSTFNYAFSNYCLNDANPIPDAIATSGGVFTIDNGGFVDPVTGEIDLALSSLGTDTTGNFNVTYTTADPCTTNTTVTVAFEEFFDASFEFPENVCIDEANPTATNIVTTGGTFSVDNRATISASGELNLNTTTAGIIYTISYEISGNCTPIVTHTIEVVAEDDSSFSYPNNIVCIDDVDAIPTSVVLGGVYTIDSSGVIDAATGAVNLSDSGAGDFVITYTTPDPCSTFSTYTLTIVDILFDENTVVSSVVECDTYALPTLAEGNYFTDANGGGSTLSNGDEITATQTIYVFNESNTIPNCTDEYTFTVTIINSPIANTPITELDSCNNGDGSANFDINASSIEDEIVGSQTGLTVTYHPTQEDAENETNTMSTLPFLVATGNIWARVEGANNCFAVTEVTLKVEQCFLIFPEVFSPNSEVALNREFNVDGLRDMFPNFDMFVYNRYGKEVYYGNASKTENWNGKDDNSGGELPTGTYYFILKLNDPQQITHRGWVYLQR